MDALGIVQNVLTNLSHTAATRELVKHMAVYSNEVELFGVPGHPVLGRKDIELRRRNEFTRGLLMRIAYNAPEILTAQRDSIVYRVLETMKSTDGQLLQLNKEITLQLEPDGAWRIRTERITRARVRAANELV